MKHAKSRKTVIRKKRGGTHSRKRLRTSSPKLNPAHKYLKHMENVANCENKITDLEEEVDALKEQLKEEYEKRRTLLSQMIKFEQELQPPNILGYAYPAKNSPIYIDDVEPE